MTGYRQSLRKPTVSLAAYDCLLRGLAHFRGYAEDDNQMPTLVQASGRARSQLASGPVLPRHILCRAGNVTRPGPYWTNGKEPPHSRLDKRPR